MDPLLPEFKTCGRSSARRSLVGSAPSILPDLVRRWTTEFSRLCRMRILVPPPFGPPLAERSPQLRKFIEGKNDFAFLTRDMSEADVATYRRFHGHAPLAIPIAAGSYRHFGFVDAVAVIVNRDNPVERLTLAQVGRIFFEPAPGHQPPRSWSDLDPRWTKAPIHIVGSSAWRPIESARAGFLRHRLTENAVQARTWRMDAAAAANDANTPMLVAADPDAIGLTGLGHLVPGDKPVALSLGPARTALAPSYRNVALGLYPLARTIDLLVSAPRGGRLDPGLCSFARFLLSRRGQRIVRDEEVFLPLRHVQVNRSRRLLARIC